MEPSPREDENKASSAELLFLAEIATAPQQQEEEKAEVQPGGFRADTSFGDEYANDIGLSNLDTESGTAMEDTQVNDDDDEARISHRNSNTDNNTTPSARTFHDTSMNSSNVAQFPYTNSRQRNSQLVVATPIEDPSDSSTTNHNDDIDVVLVSEETTRNSNHLLHADLHYRDEEAHNSTAPSFGGRGVEDAHTRPVLLVHAKPANVTDSAMDVVRSRRGRWLLLALILLVVLVAGGSAFRLVSGSNNDDDDNDINANSNSRQDGNGTIIDSTAASNSSHTAQQEQKNDDDGSILENDVPAMLQQSLPTTAPSKAPNISPETNVPGTDLEASFVALLPNHTLNALKDVLSPQSRALKWLLQDHPPHVLANYTDCRKIQRFTLASLYYSTNGQGWHSRQFWLTMEDECLWWSYLQLSTSIRHRGESLCNENGEYSFLLMDENRLIGTIVPELALLSSLQEISLVADNFFVNDKTTELLVGSIPSEIGLLTNLQLFAVGKNWLSSSIPSELGQLSNSLQTLSVLENAITGALPSEIGRLSLLNDLILYSNQLTQVLPSELGMLSSSLERLDAIKNQLTGSLPTSLGRLTGLIALKLQENAISGSIPSEIGLLKPLNVLHLQENRLVGFIPPELGNMNQLTQLWLGYNVRYIPR